MKTIRDVMTAEVVWVSPSARVKTAVILMKGHSIGALPVVHTDDAVVGVVTLANLIGESPEAAVSDVMEAGFTAVEPQLSIYDAAETMMKSGASHLLVIENDRLVGIVSRGDLLPELGKTFDPLTELPWSDSLREWAVGALKRRVEISIILFDLDQFGRFNKEHGHVVGDKVLKEVSRVLKEGIDPEIDFLCRYGGDEFGIVSIRKADDAIALADSLRNRISEIRVEGLPEAVSGTYGMFGGRRTKERLDIHYDATLDDLITRASRNCTANKPHQERPTEPAPTPVARKEFAPSEGRAPRLNIQNITYSTSGAEARVAVSLAQDNIEYAREVSGYTIDSISALRLVAEATAAAACKSLAPGHGIVVEDVGLYDIGREEEMVTVVCAFITPRWTARLVGSAVVRRGDQYRAAAAALLAAVNRLLETAPRALVEEAEHQESS